MTHQKLLSALLLFAAPYLLAQKSDHTPPFDPKTAAEFLAAAPDFAEYAKKFAERADSLYSATKYDDAGAAYFASKFLGFLADYSPSASKEYVAYMLGRPELIEEFCTELSPKDDRAKVAKIILDIWDSDSATFKKYPRLALAIAIVFDTPPPKTWPHDQVSEKYLPRKFPEPVQAFADWKSARERGRLLTQFERMSIAELKYLVASLATNEDREWARKSVSLTVAGVGKLYGSVPYDYQRLNAKRFDWDGADYRLRTILKSGGICTDQAYYTAETAKSRGIPAFIFTGAGSDGFHAWTAAMKLEIRNGHDNRPPDMGKSLRPRARIAKGGVQELEKIPRKRTAHNFRRTLLLVQRLAKGGTVGTQGNKLRQAQRKDLAHTY